MQGLAFQPLSKLGVTPPFFSMEREGLLDWSGFSLWLNPDTRSQTAPAGELIFGGADDGRYSGPIRYHPNQSARSFRIPSCKHHDTSSTHLLFLPPLLKTCDEGAQKTCLFDSCTSCKSTFCRYWALTLDGFKIGGRAVDGLNSKEVLLDSGTSLIFTSDDDAAVLNKACLSTESLRAKDDIRMCLRALFRKTHELGGGKCLVGYTP